MSKKNFSSIIVLMLLVFVVFLSGCYNGGMVPSIPNNEVETPTDTPLNHKPVINSSPVTSATVGQFYNYHVEAYDADEDVLVYSLPTSPNGMFIDSFTGLITWIPDYKGDYEVIVKVSDGESFASQYFTITVMADLTLITNQKPFASFIAYPLSGSVPLMVNFDASASYDPDGNVVEYVWDFKDGETGYGQKVNHTFNSAGNYYVTLTVMDNSGETTSTSKTITVTGNVTPPTNSDNLNYLEGAIIIANDNQYLGKISQNQYDLDSINNRFGNYGSEFSLYSIFNSFGTYGSKFSILSPFNQFNTSPPKIYKNYIFVAFYTINTFMFPRVDSYLLVSWLNR